MSRGSVGSGRSSPSSSCSTLVIRWGQAAPTRQFDAPLSRNVQPQTVPPTPYRAYQPWSGKYPTRGDRRDAAEHLPINKNKTRECGGG